MNAIINIAAPATKTLISLMPPAIMRTIKRTPKKRPAYRNDTGRSMSKRGHINGAYGCPQALILMMERTMGNKYYCQVRDKWSQTLLRISL